MGTERDQIPGAVCCRLCEKVRGRHEDAEGASQQFVRMSLVGVTPDGTQHGGGGFDSRSSASSYLPRGGTQDGYWEVRVLPVVPWFRFLSLFATGIGYVILSLRQQHTGSDGQLDLTVHRYPGRGQGMSTITSVRSWCCTQGTRGGPQGTRGGPQGTMGGPQGTRGGPQGTRGGPEGTRVWSPGH